jgi:putative addiction module component (TIGR02574 family)
MTAASIPESIFELPIEDRITLADRLYASVPSEWQGWADREWLREVERRDAELDANPAMELTHEQFLAEFQSLRRKK